MNTVDPGEARRTQLRFVFDDSVVSFRLGSHPTLGQIAWIMRDLALRHDAKPLAIDVRLAPPPNAGVLIAAGANDAR